MATDLRLVDLFAGAGGASLGALRAGFRLVAAVEWDADACATHRVTLPDCPVFEGDVRSFTPPAADVWWASPPCQAWSHAGKRKGSADERNGWPWVWDAYDRAVHKPHTLVCENVVGSLHHTKKPGRCGSPSKCAGCYWEQKVLKAARARFTHVDYRVLNCADFGVPQARRRVILVCSDKPYTWPTPTHGPSAARGWVSMGEALGLECVIDGMRNTPQNPRQERVRGSHEPAPTIGTRGNAIVTTPEGRRRLTVEEVAVLQDMEGVDFQGKTKKSRFAQVGNAVPPRLAEVILGEVARG